MIFDAWAQCSEGDWAKSKFLMQIRERHTTKRTGCRKWLFDWEMDQRFGAEIGDMLRQAKLADPQLSRTEARYFPGVPQSDKTRQFKTLVDDVEDDVHEEEVEQLFSCLDESSSSSSLANETGKAGGLCRSEKMQIVWQTVPKPKPNRKDTAGKSSKKEKDKKTKGKKEKDKDNKSKNKDTPEVAAQKALLKNCKKALVCVFLFFQKIDKRQNFQKQERNRFLHIPRQLQRHPAS